MKTQHDGDCSIYASLSNIGMVEAGICTCGYGHAKNRQDAKFDAMYSGELEKKLSKNGMSDKEIEDYLTKIFGKPNEIN